jgi:hypothetical protein
MPFNRISLLKAFSTWMTVLQAKEKKEREFQQAEEAGKVRDLMAPESTSREPKAPLLQTYPFRKPLKYWFPGLMVIPIPEAGPILGYIDIGFWACMTYVIGSVFYVMDSFYLWPRFYTYTDDANDPGVVWNTVSAAAFVFNALICFVDWYMQKKQLSCMNLNIEDETMGIGQYTDISSKITRYYFLNNLFFLAAAVTFLIQGIWMEDQSLDQTNCYPTL